MGWSWGKSLILGICLISATYNMAAQVPYSLEKEFKYALQRNFSEKEFVRFFQLLDSLDHAGTDLSAFRTYKTYTSSIPTLLNSTNYYQKGIAYKLVATLNDKSFCPLLLERMATEDNPFLKTLNAEAIMHLMPKETTICFDYLVDSEGFATSPLLPVFLSMDAKNIISTAYKRLNDERPRAKVFALQILARFDPDEKVDSLIINALKNWDVSIKGYAIVALGVHRKNDLKEILAPYFKEPILQEVIIEILEQSNTYSDHLYAEQLKKKKY